MTTVRDLGDRSFSVVQRRDRQGAAAAAEPAIVASGPPLTIKAGHCFFLGGEVSGTQEIIRAVAERAERGVDVVKVMASGGASTPDSDVMLTQFTAAVPAMPGTRRQSSISGPARGVVTGGWGFSSTARTSVRWETVMKVFVAGGSGAMGRRLVPQLVPAGNPRGLRAPLGVLGAYQRRRLTAVAVPGAGVAMLAPGMPAIAGQNNWTPLGPSVVARGQTASRAAIAGRVSGVAIAPGGSRLYVATANGGVWRSDDGGLSWRSTMDGFDEDPTNFATTSLACGAVAIDPADPDRVYVGTGEGDTDALFAVRVVGALPAYRGIGPIRSDDGGVTWHNEPSSPSLAGFSFFQIAVDPANPDHCVAATTNGLYERIPSGAAFTWQRRRTGIHTSVVVTRASGTTTWFAAAQADRVYSSSTAATWTALGTGFPTGIGRIALGAQPDNPNVLYAFVATSAGALHSVQRLDGTGGAWRAVSGVPAVLPGGQGSYDLCIAVDPSNANRIYLGGDFFNVSPFPGSIWRCEVSTTPTLTITGTSIGQNAHSDVHVLTHVPGSSNRLFAGTDGGLFEHPDATGVGGFVSRNTGLGSLCTNFIGQHPTEQAVLYVGLQDNGSAKGTGEEVWRHVLSGDGGYCVVNWRDPFQVMLFANGRVFRATDGALDYPSWIVVTPPGRHLGGDGRAARRHAAQSRGPR